jgi:pyrroline-5-carboxylate reductase
VHVVLMGAGNLGTALARGWLTGGALDPRELTILVRSDSYRSRAPELAPLATYDPGSLAAADVVVVAVKPKDIPSAYPVLRHAAPGAVIVSLAAGTRLAQLAEGLPGWPLARAMPNICAAVGKAATALTFHAAVRKAERESVLSLFRPLGYTFEAEESLFDAITALSGSGPAYVYLVMEALTKAGEELGLPTDLSRTLATHTFEGAALMALTHGDQPFAHLIRQVASPGGTTEAALHRMRELSVQGAIVEGITSAKARAERIAMERVVGG